MNTRLEFLFQKYNISEKNKYEIKQIYNLLSDYKKQNLIKNFEYLASKLNNIELSISLEREILIGNSVEKITNYILEKRKQKIKNKNEDKKEIASFL